MQLTFSFAIIERPIRVSLTVKNHDFVSIQNENWHFFSFFRILHFADTLSLTTRIEMYMKKTILSSSDMQVAENHRTIIIVNSIGKVDFSPIYRRMINISFSNATMERITWNRITRISQSFKRDQILHNDKIYLVWNSSNVYLKILARKNKASFTFIRNKE